MERNVHRIEGLQVSSPSSQWFEKMIPKMSHLSAINVFEAPGLPKGPNLKCMRLKGASLDRIYKEPPMTSITYLDLHWIPIDLSILLLIKCPNLVEFSCHNHLPRRTSSTNVRLPTLVFDQLSTFSWSTPDARNSQLHDQLFECLHVPALQRFCLDNDQKLKLNTATFTFFSRLPKSMNKLEFRCIDHKIEGGILRNVVNDAEISCIHLSFCSPMFLMDVFSTLSETTKQGTFRFPNLTCIEVGQLGGRFLDPPLEWWIGQKLALTLQDRAGTMDRFTFMSHNSRLVGWHDEIWGIFKELKVDGLDLTIIDSGNKMDIEAKYEEEFLKDWTSDSDKTLEKYSQSK